MIPIGAIPDMSHRVVPAIWPIQWKCEADLESGVRFGRTDVVCEGYRNRFDDDVLAGSCALEYELEGRPAGGSDSWSNTRNSRNSARADSAWEPAYTGDSGRYSTTRAIFRYGAMLLLACVVGSRVSDRAVSD